MSAAWNPDSSMRRCAGPSGTLLNENAPERSEVVSRGLRAPSSVSTTAAPGSTAPESSTTAPRTTAWAAATLVMVIAKKIARRAGAKRFIIRSPSTSDVSALSHRSHAHLLVSSQQREELREELAIVTGHDGVVEHETEWTVGGRNRRRDGCSPRFG